MSRVITAISFDLKFNVLSTPPSISVHFTGVAPGGQETQGRTTIADVAARVVWDGITKGEPMLDVINAALDAQAASVAEPGTVTERITAANEAEERRKNAEAVKAALDAQAEAVDADVKAKQSAAAELDEQLAAKRAELDALQAAR